MPTNTSEIQLDLDLALDGLDIGPCVTINDDQVPATIPLQLLNEHIWLEYFLVTYNYQWFDVSNCYRLLFPYLKRHPEMKEISDSGGEYMYIPSEISTRVTDLFDPDTPNEPERATILYKIKIHRGRTYVDFNTVEGFQNSHSKDEIIDGLICELKNRYLHVLDVYGSYNLLLTIY